MRATVSSRAYTKVMLHACKYPHKAVNGVLLGREVEGGDLQLLDAIPLFHQCLGLKPMLEIALMQVCGSHLSHHTLVAGGNLRFEKFYLLIAVYDFWTLRLWSLAL